MKKLVLILLLSGISLMAFDAPKVYKKCMMCHGKKGEKVALKSSPVINALSVDTLTQRLNGLLDGSSTISSKYIKMHQSKLKGVSAAESQALAAYITALK